MRYMGTREVAGLLNIRPSALTRAVWENRIGTPEKGPGNAFWWSEKNIRQAAWVLIHRDLDTILAEREEEDQP